jgi:hypothetical protein
VEINACLVMLFVGLVTDLPLTVLHASTVISYLLRAGNASNVLKTALFVPVPQFAQHVMQALRQLMEIAVGVRSIVHNAAKMTLLSALPADMDCSWSTESV